jgi:chemotaxis response regulator CheB
MTGNIVVIGGSAGSLAALRALVASLPEELNAAIFVSVHRSSPLGFDVFPMILGRHSHMEVTFAIDGQAFEYGRIYVSPPKVHLLVEPGVLRIDTTPKPGRPSSVDALFASAAKAYGEAVIGVILSGMMDDGTAGSWEIRKHGGVIIAQDVAEAAFPSMPQSAMKNVPVHYCLPVAEIAVKIKDLVTGACLPPLLHNARVMIVEDEWMLASELERQLTDLHYTVVATVASGEEALAKAEAVMPDLVMMDVVLAGDMKGTEAARHLWERFEIPLIFLTAHTDQETLAAAQLSMPYAFLPKPHHAGQLHSAMQLALGRRQREIGKSAALSRTGT